MPRGCLCCHNSYPGTKLLPEGLWESSAHQDWMLPTCLPGTSHGRPPARHLGGKTHAGPARRIERPRRNEQKPFVLHISCVSFSAASAGEARDESKLSALDVPLQGLSAVLPVTVRSAPARSPPRCAQPRHPHPKVHILPPASHLLCPTTHTCFTHSCQGGGATMTLPGIVEPPMGISGENPNLCESGLGVPHSHSTALGLRFIFAPTSTIGIVMWSNSSALEAFLEEMTPRHSLTQQKTCL